MEEVEKLYRDFINRLERRQKILLWTTSILWSILIIITFYNYAKLNVPKEENQIIEHTVKYYEQNLTQIANKYYPDEYLPKALASIKNLNNMTESDITEGQVLKVEVKK